MHIAEAQQIPQFTQYILNPFIVNPAYAGTTEHYDLKASYRKQWLGIDDSPSTMYFTVHGHVGKEHPRMRGKSKGQNTRHHGIGATVMRDQTGPLSNTRISATYAYDLTLTQNIRMSFGASAGIKSLQTDLSKIKLNDGTNDVGSVSNNFNSLTPDLSLGVYLYSNKFFVGLSAQNLIFTEINKSIFGLDKKYYKNNNYYSQHLFVQAGYVFAINELFSVIPSTMVKYAINTPTPSVDLNAKVKYNNMLWAGINYRTNDAVGAFIGLLFDKKYEVSYAYDYGISNISIYGSGSHEIMIGYRIQPKFEVKSPSDYW